jgi:hypothetical protein
MSKAKKQNIVLVVGFHAHGVVKRLVEIKKKHKLRLALITNAKPQNEDEQMTFDLFDIVTIVNFNSPKSIQEGLHPYKDEIIATTCRSEPKIPYFQKVVPHVPYVYTPTAESLGWATNKVDMRKRFASYDKNITPKFMVVKDAQKKTLIDIEDRVGFPLVIKPSGLAQSLLVTICFHKEELEKNLKRVFRKIDALDKEYKTDGQAQVIVEQFLDGRQYSIDAYVNSKGKVYFCPLVYIKTGREIGFDDFFGYQQNTPSRLNKESVAAAEEACRKAIHALSLRSVTAHVELMTTEQGWKVIEAAPRIGGFRDAMYKLSFGIDHTENDILIRMGKIPVIPKKTLGSSAVMKFFAKKEGKITTLTGTKKAQKLKSFHDITINKKIGDKAIYAKHGGKSVFNITLFNVDGSKLLADIRRLEQMIKIETK